MKGRQSGMPDETWWATFFDVDRTLDLMFGAGGPKGDIVEFGCGYGTFTIPAARRTRGIFMALDIEPEMVTRVASQSAEARLGNVHAILRDFVAQGTGLDDSSQDHAMIFNLLHLEDPHALLREAARILRPGGVLSVIHWRSDIPTPRGPSLDIRPTPAQCHDWIETAGFRAVRGIDLQGACPYHFALTAER